MSDKLLKVGELAKRVGKSVRAIHLYEEMGLLRPASRSSGGFRQFDEASVERIRWILKLQAIGFSLTEIQGFIRDFEGADSGRTATARVRQIFDAKLQEIGESIARLKKIQSELIDSLSYLETCQSCAPEHLPSECHECGHKEGSEGHAPELFAGLSQAAENTNRFDVAASNLVGRVSANPPDSEV
jgi:DNA-binding transcriptional MerR regulator